MHSAISTQSADEEFSLLQQVGFARFPDDVGDVAHRAVHRQRARLLVLQKPEQRAHHADRQAEDTKWHGRSTRRHETTHPATTAD